MPSVTVTFSAPVLLSSLSNADLTVDGNAAIGFQVVNDHTVHAGHPRSDRIDEEAIGLRELGPIDDGQVHRLADGSRRSLTSPASAMY